MVDAGEVVCFYCEYCDDEDTETSDTFYKCPKCETIVCESHKGDHAAECIDWDIPSKSEGEVMYQCGECWEMYEIPDDAEECCSE